MKHPVSWRVGRGFALALAASMALISSAAGARDPESYVEDCRPPDPGEGIDCANAAKIDAPCPPGQSFANCVHVLKIGKPTAQHVLILLAGDSEGAAVFRSVAHYISSAVPDTQVWAIERRQQQLADMTSLRSPDAARRYLAGEYRKPSEAELRAAMDWGLAAAIEDIHRVILDAQSRGPRQVFLGGHSWGATLALTYAAWDFAGVAGYRDLAGLVLIDGGVHDSFAGEGYKFRLTDSDVDKQLKRMRDSGPFTGDIGFLWGLKGASEKVPILYQLAAAAALSDPHAPSQLQDRLPEVMRPTVSVTNAALLGWLLDTHAPTDDFRVRMGHLDDGAGPVHDWVETGPARLRDVAEAFAGTNPAGLEWYWPRRLSLDLEAIDPFVPSPVTARLNLSLDHASKIDTPLFVFETGLAHGTVNRAAQWVVSNSAIGYSEYHSDHSMTHLDPLFAEPSRNAFLKTLSNFLLRTRRLRAGSLGSHVANSVMKNRSSPWRPLGVMKTD